MPDGNDEIKDFKIQYHNSIEERLLIISIELFSEIDMDCNKIRIGWLQANMENSGSHKINSRVINNRISRKCAFRTLQTL